LVLTSNKWQRRQLDHAFQNRVEVQRNQYGRRLACWLVGVLGRNLRFCVEHGYAGHAIPLSTHQDHVRGSPGYWSIRLRRL